MKHDSLHPLRTASVLGLTALLGCAASRPAATPTPKPVAKPAPAAEQRDGGWVLLVGESADALGKWKVVGDADFSSHGAVGVENGVITLGTGSPATGITWTGDFPRMDYEITLEAMRVEGHDFFCGLTFPVGESPCTLIVGGWGGMVVGLSNIDDMHAAENETTQGISFDNKKWYPIRLHVTADRIQVWIEGDRIINLETTGRRFDIWPEQEPVKPLGVSTWYTKAALRNIRFRRVTAADDER